MPQEFFRLTAPIALLLLLLLACLGWGATLLRLVGGSKAPAPENHLCLSLLFGLATLCWGLQGLAVLQYFSMPAAAAILIAGCAFGCRPGWSACSRTFKSPKSASAPLLVAALACILLTCLPPALNAHDDTTAYLTFVLKIRDLGGIGWEPFSERRLFLAGANYPLQALVLSFLPMNNAGIIEPALGISCAVAFAAFLTTPRRTALSALLLGLSVLSGSRVLANFSPAYLFLPPLLYLLHAATHPCICRGPLRAAALGVMSGFAICLRPTAAPFELFLVLWALWQASGTGIPRFVPFLKSLGAATAGGVAFCFPFSLDLLRSSGTALYPILGRGFHSSALGRVPSISSVTPWTAHFANLTSIPASDPLLWIAIILIGLDLRSSPPRRKHLLTLLAGTLITYEIIIWQTGGTSSSRYMAPFLLTICLYAIGTTAFPSVKAGRAVTSSLVLTAAIGLILGSPRLWSLAAAKISVRMHALFPPPDVIADYRALQFAVPPGSTILASLGRNDLLDRRRNRVLVNDLPGMTGPPPGWPADMAAPGIAAYLRHFGVDYIAVHPTTTTPEALQLRIARPPKAWLDIVDRTCDRYYLALADTPFRESVIYKTKLFIVYRVP